MLYNKEEAKRTPSITLSRRVSGQIPVFSNIFLKKAGEKFVWNKKSPTFAPAFRSRDARKINFASDMHRKEERFNGKRKINKNSRLNIWIEYLIVCIFAVAHR